MKQGLKASTVFGYLQIWQQFLWEQFLNEHFTGPIRAAIHANPDHLSNIRALVIGAQSMPRVVLSGLHSRHIKI